MSLHSSLLLPWFIPGSAFVGCEICQSSTHHSGSEAVAEFCAPARLCIRNRDVNLWNIKSLKYIPQSQTQTVVSHIKMVLVNARSVSNKTFILNDFFTSHKLDYIFSGGKSTEKPYSSKSTITFQKCSVSRVKYLSKKLLE